MLALPWQAREAQAQQPTPEIPSRKTSFSINVDLYAWWMVRWSNNAVQCEIVVDHEGAPTHDEIYHYCGEELYEDWFDTSACELIDKGEDTSQCPGVYLSWVGQGVGEKTVNVDLPLPDVWLSLEGCTLEPPINRCSGQPSLIFDAYEPLPNESVIRINGFYGGQAFSCAGSRCRMPLAATGTQGLPLEFWAVSSFGDTSEHFSALIRVTPWGDFSNPEAPGNDPEVWFVDVLSSQWRSSRQASCGETWQVFPPVGGAPGWLSTPDDASLLESALSYYYLAGMLIRNGNVDASQCPDGGLAGENLANECGLTQAYPEVVAWQNRFNGEIMRVALDSGVPAQLLKNIFARESQFWPGIYLTYKEAGLGQLTEQGAGTVLLWNTSFYNQFCPLVLHQETCDRSFGNLQASDQAMLRGALMQQVNASCADCLVGINLEQANFSVGIFADSLLANCRQVDQMFFNITGEHAGENADYVDLWRITLANYNAGSGCVGDAIEAAIANGSDLTWDNIRNYLDIGCRGAIEYVDTISQVPAPQPTPTSWLQPGGGLPPVATGQATGAPPQYQTTPTPAQALPTPYPENTVTPYPENSPTPTPIQVLPYP